ncbi:MAG: acetyltransferase [Rhodocyclales bacterium]|nr:acetyltransferase [Rhodocyclales bacterium]
MATHDPEQLAAAVRAACIQAALDGYEQAQIAGLCHEGAWECAVDAIRRLEIDVILQQEASAVGDSARTGK